MRVNEEDSEDGCLFDPANKMSGTVDPAHKMSGTVDPAHKMSGTVNEQL